MPKNTGTGDQSPERARNRRSDYPEDRFDRVVTDQRVGAHRVTARPRYVWQYLIAGLLGFALLTTIGIIAVHNFDAGSNLPSITPKQHEPKSQAVEPELDPEATVAVLNGSETKKLAAALEKIITDEQWGQILYSGSAAESDVEISAVFYSDPADEEAAAGLAAKLGGLSTYTTDEYEEYGVRLVVLLGADYAGPGIDEAEQMRAAEAEEDAAADEPSEEPEIDPATGWEIDPETGWPVNPETGEPVDPATLE